MKKFSATVILLLALSACGDGSLIYAGSHDCALSEAHRREFAFCINQPIFNSKTDLYRAIGMCDVKAWAEVRKQTGEE
jgi:hypothetical protein